MFVSLCLWFARIVRFAQTRKLHHHEIMRTHTADQLYQVNQNIICPTTTRIIIVTSRARKQALFS